MTEKEAIELLTDKDNAIHKKVMSWLNETREQMVKNLKSFENNIFKSESSMIEKEATNLLMDKNNCIHNIVMCWLEETRLQMVKNLESSSPSIQGLRNRSRETA